MAQHFSRSTVSVSSWCARCNRNRSTALTTAELARAWIASTGSKRSTQRSRQRLQTRSRACCSRRLRERRARSLEHRLLLEARRESRRDRSHQVWIASWVSEARRRRERSAPAARVLRRWNCGEALTEGDTLKLSTILDRRFFVFSFHGHTMTGAFFALPWLVHRRWEWERDL